MRGHRDSGGWPGVLGCVASLCTSVLADGRYLLMESCFCPPTACSEDVKTVVYKMYFTSRGSEPTPAVLGP